MMTVQQAFDLALQHHQAGRLAEAEALYRQILAVQPTHADSLHLFGVLAHQTGRSDAAAEMIRRAIAIDPSNAATHSNLATVCLAIGRPGEAAACSRRAVEIVPDFADAHYNLGAALMELGQMEEAVAAYRRALEIRPDNTLAQNNVGNALRKLGRWDEAIEWYRRALQLEPGNADTHNNLGVALNEKGQMDEAVASYRRALELEPKRAVVHHNLGNVFSHQGHYPEAIAAYRRAIQLQPDRPDTFHNMGIVLARQGELEEAACAFGHAVRNSPDYAEAWNSLGNVRRVQGLIEEALASYRRALEIRPNDTEGLYSLGNVLQLQCRLDEALSAYHRVLELNPKHVEARYRLAEIYKDQGRWQEATQAVRQVLALMPDDPGVRSDLILILQICPTADETAIAVECRQWNDRFGVPLRRSAGPPICDSSPERKLRIGYVSPDFRDHVVGRNLLPLFREHDRTHFEVVCYSGAVSADDCTAEFRRRADRWRDTSNLSDEALAEIIREDAVDILVDLSLHAAGNRLSVFARQPAPVQVSFASYPGGTGLETIAYRISDRYLESGEMGNVVSGKATLIDSFWCYDPCGCELEVNALPADANGFVTFGSMNNFCKINEGVLDLWARVLAAVKGSRLVVLSYEGSHRQRITEILAADGIEPERIRFVEPRPREHYLEYYHRFDIELDAFPYNGHTTSLEALWMGVPVVSLAGDRVVSRAGLSQLSNLGLPELVASTEEDYVGIAAGLAGDLPRLAELRRTLRSRMEKSVLMDAPRFARQIEAAYRAMWREWCAKEAVQ